VNPKQLSLVGDVVSSLEVRFEAWWSGYPVKRDKKPAFRVWKAKVRAGATPDQLIAARDNYLRQAIPPYIKYPATFLGVWEEWLTGPSRASVGHSPGRRESLACPDCQQLADYCQCGQVLRTRNPGH
jgi:hypothetical protein